MPIEISSRDGILQYSSQEASLLVQGLADDGNPTPPLNNLRSNGTLWVIGHASQVGDGRGLVQEINRYFPRGLPSGARVHLVVCNASDGGVHSVAQRVADALQVRTRGYERPVRLQHGFHEPSNSMQDVRHSNMFAQAAYQHRRSTYYVDENWRTHDPFRPDVEMTDAPDIRYSSRRSRNPSPQDVEMTDAPDYRSSQRSSSSRSQYPQQSGSSHSHSRSHHRRHGVDPYPSGSSRKKRR